MRVLALDQATTTGWAFGDNHSFETRTVESGVFKMPKRQILGERLQFFADGLSERVAFYKPELIAYEEPYWPPPGGPGGTVTIGRVISMLAGQRSKGELIGILKKIAKDEHGSPTVSAEVLQFLQMVKGILVETACRLKLPVEGYRTQSWRKTALGHGRVEEPKKAMKLRAAQLGYPTESEDEADAIGILLHALHGEPASKRAQGDLLEMAGADL